MSVTVDPFSMRNIPQGRTFLILGKRNTGKTVLTIDICFHRQAMEFGIAFAGSIGSELEFARFLPSTFIYGSFSDEVLRAFWEKVKSLNRKAARNGEKMVDCFLILDDTGFDKSMWQSKSLIEIMQNGRHYNLTLIICMQYGKALHPNMRSQIDYLFVLKEKSPEMLDKIYSCFCGGHFQDKHLFRAVLNQCTRDYRALVVKNADVIEGDGEFDGGIYFYKAKLHKKPFYVGSKAMWQYHYTHFNEHYESDEERNKKKDNSHKSASKSTAILPRGKQIEVVCRRERKTSKR